MYSDKTKLNQIITNLLSNAFKYISKGKIEFGCKLTDPFIRFYVKDTGIGIPPKELNSIFDRFRRIEDDTEVVREGLGLGLSISKAFAGMLGGDLSARSSVGEGSEFWLTLKVNEY